MALWLDDESRRNIRRLIANFSRFLAFPLDTPIRPLDRESDHCDNHPAITHGIGRGRWH